MSIHVKLHHLTRYRYEKMTSFATYLPSGDSQNDVIFNGRSYDLYMEGTTDARNYADYEVGLILLSPPQSPQWNHRYRVGRVPLLNVRGYIRDGKLVDDEVSYPWPTQSLFAVFLKNNLAYRAWLAATGK